MSDHRMLFIGKATNGWVTNDVDAELLFNPDYAERIVNRDDEMEWVLNRWGKDGKDADGVKYNTKRSAFWRVIKSVTCATEKASKNDDWVQFISWSNLYKVSLEEGNPPTILKTRQQEACCKILDLELEVLRPKNVIFLTSGWEKFYLTHIGFQDLKDRPHICKKWGYAEGFETYCFVYSGINIIVSPHPQGKDEYAHAETICSLLK